MTTQSATGVTVAEIVAQPHLAFEVLTGHRGLDRAVSWAYVADSERPWDWVDPGDIVLTSGWVIPRDPPAQEKFVERLAAAGMSGLVVSDERCPPLSDEMLDAAVRRNFPIIKTDAGTSWASIIRFVARANQSREGRVLSSIMRVHDVVRIGLLAFRTSLEFLDDLMDVVGCELYVVDPDAWEPLLPRTQAPPPSWGRALTKALAERGGGTPPLSIKLEIDDTVALALPIPSNRPAFLFADVSSGVTPRLALLQHVGAACALEIAHVEALFDKEWRAGSALMSEALQGRLEPTAFTAGVREMGLELPCICVAVGAPPETAERIDRYWAIRRVPHIVMQMGWVHVMLIAAEEERLEDLRMLSAKLAFRAGISEPFLVATALGDASRQARWALETLRPGVAGVAAYGDEGHSFLPRTLAESEQAVERILGPLIDYDSEHDGELVKTLHTYLECDRSPKRAAAELFVHNQTVNYRLARVQELTGRSLRSTADISELWLALRALALTRTAERRD
ncbi:PucR family transcriptional regulator ligand-binding domain-containing protein [Conexibacter stalactiti]|uniref:PucR family transcriptional regulator ligand-binding domain-containing protein n=1 Tax=Conexibacter stalactiti TaxID=1940611 RepID=A0ABU4HIE6_9ACTN|nr:PucR family transcriptional regulator ligand-binding domain-containing protein [Conexibacter stalactiti]MDW5593073.1 PucR family transcriptional regulator ligand-binding domain-containing protein [Conexibacter stalactiti]MEC5033714.1 PucR family transcriptional regulator ligand-binding domain-containing protein [Conexibacter stalactiti]